VNAFRRLTSTIERGSKERYGMQQSSETDAAHSSLPDA